MAPILVRESMGEQDFCVEIVKEVQTPVRLCAELAELPSLYRSGACAT